MQSKRWFDYYADDGNIYAIQRDESNVRLVNPSGDCGAITSFAPKREGLTPRSVAIQFPSGAIRHCSVLKTSQFSLINVGDVYVAGPFEANDVTGTSGRVIYKTGESLRRQPRVTDTGMLDATQP
jgi:hypothetical protein